MGIKKMNIDAVAKAIAVNMGESLPDLPQALKEAKAGMIGRITTPEHSLEELCAQCNPKARMPKDLKEFSRAKRAGRELL